MSRTSAKGATCGLTPPRISLSAKAKLSRNSLRGGAAEQRRQEQAVGFEGAADLDQRAGQVVDGLQRVKADARSKLRLAGGQKFPFVEIRQAPIARRRARSRRGSGIADPEPMARNAASPPSAGRSVLPKPPGRGSGRRPCASRAVRAACAARKSKRAGVRRPSALHREDGPKLKTGLLDLLFPPLCIACRRAFGRGPRLLSRLAGAASPFWTVRRATAAVCLLAFDPGPKERAAPPVWPGRRLIRSRPRHLRL